MINGNTKLICLLGSPVAHSFSPYMHNAAFEKMEIDASYMAFDVKTEALETILLGLKTMSFIGCNVTSPHKLSIMPFLDEIDEKAKLIGAVNTVVNHDGHLKGYNTDVDGFIESFYQKQITLKDKKIAILGTGGASKAIAIGLLLEGVGHIDVFSRTLKKSKDFVEEVRLKGIYPKTYELLSDSKAYDIVVNCTPIGMHPYEGQTPLDPSRIGHDETVFYDLIYNPRETKFLELARKSGRETINGLDMLIFQGIYALKYWLPGINVDTMWHKEDVLEVLVANNVIEKNGVNDEV